jgi:IS30 family transposase
MNGKLRRFFPKGTDFASVTAQELQEVVTFYNTRPMKCLGYRTPEEVFDDELVKLRLNMDANMDAKRKNSGKCKVLHF